MSLVRKLFGAGAAAPPDIPKLNATTEAALARSLSALPPDERGWITFAEACSLFSAERAEYAFGELDQSGREKIEAFAAQHRAVISFMPLEARVYFARDPNAANVRFTPESGH
jgi:hypothetical protein